MHYLLDTNHCSYILQGIPSVIQKFGTQTDHFFSISVITQSELIYMAQKSNLVKENLRNVDSLISSFYVYEIDQNIAKICGELKAKVFSKFAPKDRKRRRKVTLLDLGIQENDIWIAATVIQHNCILVSSDRDFYRIKEVWDFTIENWA